MVNFGSSCFSYGVYRLPGRIVVTLPANEVFKAAAAPVISRVFNSFYEVFRFAFYFYRRRRWLYLARKGSIRQYSGS